MWEILTEAASISLTLANLFGAASGILIGVLLGAIPGLNGTMAIALLIPVTYTWSPLFAISMLVGCWKGSVYGGSMSAILLNTPGTPEAAATAFDGYPLACQGKAGKALQIALFASVIGSLFSDVMLVAFAPPIASLALMFGPADLAMLMVFSMVIVAGTGSESHIKGLMGATLGVLLSTVGLDPISSSRRFTFGNLELDGGVDLLAMLIGLLVMSEILVQVEEGWVNARAEAFRESDNPDDRRATWADMRHCFGAIVRSCGLGAFIGALPGLGSITAAFVGYDQAKRTSKHPENFGKGEIQGVAGPEAANNAVCGAAFIPLVTLGVPGALSVAIIMGAFLVHGLTPGPTLMHEHPATIYGLFMLFFVSDLMMLVIPLPLLRIAQKIVTVPRTYLFPIVLVMCGTGAFGTRMSLFDIKVMVFFGVLGYFLKKWNMSPAALLMTYILAPLAEVYGRQALRIAGGDPLTFVTRPVSLIFLLLTAATVGWALFSRRRSSLADRPGPEPGTGC